MEVSVEPIVREKLKGHWNARLDDKGRMKLAAEILAYFDKEADKRVFLTSVYDDIISIYPNRVWQQNLRVMAQVAEGEDPDFSESLEFLANSSGGNSEIDSQGRLLIPADIRAASLLDDQQLILVPAKERIDIYTVSQFEERRKRAQEQLADARKALQRRGLV